MKKQKIVCASFIALFVGGLTLYTQDIEASTTNTKTTIQTCVNGHENCNGECTKANHRHEQEKMHHNEHNETQHHHNNEHH